MARRLRTAILGSVFLAGVGTAFVSAQAQTAPPSRPSAAQTLPEIIVTARKRSERLLEVPVPVSAISQATMERTQSVRLQDYLDMVPSVTFDTARAGQTAITIRGVGNGGANATVVTYVDDTPFTSSTAFAAGAYVTPDLDPSDIAQVEVLRGPQGTLYGANAVGGVLKYVTVKPDPDQFSGRAEVTTESVDHGGVGGAVRAAVNLPLIADTLALRISGSDREDAGFISDPTLGKKNLNGDLVSGGRAALLWKVTKDLTVNLSATTQTNFSNGSDYANYDPFTGKVASGLTQMRSLDREWFKSRYWIYNSDIVWRLPGADLLSSTSYSTQLNGADNDATAVYGPSLSAALGQPNVGVDNPNVVHQDKITEEARLTSNGSGKLSWQVGGIYTIERSAEDESLNPFDPTTQAYLPVGPFEYIQLLDRYIEESGFANLDYQITPRFDLSVGGRYSQDNQSYTQPEGGLALGGPQPASPTAEREHALTWAVNPRYRLSHDQIVYARIATGYRPGGPNPILPGEAEAGAPASFRPDHLTSYEVGWKAQMLDRRVTVDTSIYYIDWTDIQLPESLQGYSFEANGGTAHSEGIEGAVTWRPLDGLNLSGDLSYNQNRLDRDTSPPDFNQAGMKLPGTPKMRGSFAGDYDWPVFADTKAFVGGTVYFTTARPNSLQVGYSPTNASGEMAISNFGNVTDYDPNTGAAAGTANTGLPGYATLDLRGGLEHGPWTLEVYAKNVTDARAISELGPYNGQALNLATQWEAVLLRPRTIGVSLARKF